MLRSPFVGSARTWKQAMHSLRRPGCTRQLHSPGGCPGRPAPWTWTSPCMDLASVRPSCPALDRALDMDALEAGTGDSLPGGPFHDLDGMLPTRTRAEPEPPAGAEPGGCCRTRGSNEGIMASFLQRVHRQGVFLPWRPPQQFGAVPLAQGCHASLAHRLDRQGFLVHLRPNSAGRASRRSIRAAGPWRKGFCQGVEEPEPGEGVRPLPAPSPGRTISPWTRTRTGCRLPRQRFFKGMLQDADLAGRMQGERAEPPAGRRGHDGRMILRKTTSSAFLPPSRAKFGHTGQGKEKAPSLAQGKTS